MYIEIFTAEFEKFDESNKNVNYPNSGLFIVKIKDGTSDLRLIDKSVINNHCVCPESVFKAVVTQLVDLPEPEKNKTANEVPTQSRSFNADFIIEFSRILLNRKE